MENYNIQDYESRMNLLGELYSKGEIGLRSIIANEDNIQQLKQNYVEKSGNLDKMHHGFLALADISTRLNKK